MESPPWALDISEPAKAGENRIDLLVRNTLANNCVTIPARYRGQTASGFLGPVVLNLSGGQSPAEP